MVEPVEPERLQVSLRNALAANALETEFKRLKGHRFGTRTSKDVVTRSPRMQAGLRTAEPIPALTMAEGQPIAGLLLQLSPEMAHGALSSLDTKGDIRPLAQIQAEPIRVAITYYDGQMSEVARKLRTGRSTLYRRLEDLGLEAGDLREIATTAWPRSDTRRDLLATKVGRG